VEYLEGLAKSVFGRPSLLDSSPALDYLKGILAEAHFSEGYKRNFTIATENIETGEYTLFNRDNIAFGDELAAAALSSSSIIMIFPPLHFKD
jgi:predicted acylesterase/phospholipase RssA